LSSTAYMCLDDIVMVLLKSIQVTKIVTVLLFAPTDFCMKCAFLNVLHINCGFVSRCPEILF